MYKRASEKKENIANFIKYTQALAKESPYAKKFSFDFAEYTTKLLIQSMKEGDFVTGKIILENYLDELLPYSGLDKKSEDVASNGLVLGIVTKDEKINQKICNKILGDNFDIMQMDNAVLLFNLSCYYAVYGEKQKMLNTIRQAIRHGKSPEQFLNDDDFKRYREDKDFIDVLKN